MKYTEKILEHPGFLEIQKKITQCERERIYCHHEIEHALDVCRMAWIMYLEAHADQRTEPSVLEEEKDRFYVTGLLHDIGRACQYETGEHHASAGKNIAQQILTEIGYPKDWLEETLCIVGAHHGRDGFSRENDSMGYYIQKADHLSRNCFLCEASDSCKWKDEERNLTILY